MSRIIVKLSIEDIGNLLLGGTVSTDLTIHNYDNLQSVDIELDCYGSSSAREED